MEKRISNLFVSFGCAILAAALGFHSPASAGALLLLPFALRGGQTPAQCILIAVLFYLSAGVELSSGTYTLTENLPIALAAWIVPALVLALPFGVIPRFPSIGVALAMVLTLISPFGLPSPFMLAGYLLPGTGFAGVIVLLAINQLVFNIPKKSVSLLVVMFGIITGATMTTVLDAPHTDQLIAHNLNLGPGIQADGDYRSDFIVQDHLQQVLGRQNETVPVVFPEASAGRLTQVARDRLSLIAARTEREFFAGAEVFAGQRQLDNVIIHVTPQSAEVKYRQRMPAPWFMWRASMPGFFRADLTRPAVFSHKNLRVGSILCYEISLPLLVLSTHWADPDIVIVASNLWWARHTRIPQIVEMHVQAWSRLFNVPYVSAINT